MKTEFHSHSHHSFDSRLEPRVIVSRCKSQQINNIVICDHDTFNLSEDESYLFVDAGIVVLKAIEFTTREGIHIIGMGEKIKKIEMPAYHYSAIDLIHVLQENRFFISLPHPSHSTGIIGNKNTDSDLIEFCMSRAHFIEANNFRYGKTFNIDAFLHLFPNLKMIAGSDAHRAAEVGRFSILTDGMEIKDNSCITESVLQTIYDLPIEIRDQASRSKYYFVLRKIKTSKLYQKILNYFPAKLRKNIKRFLRLI